MILYLICTFETKRHLKALLWFSRLAAGFIRLWHGYDLRAICMGFIVRILVGKPEGKRSLGRPRRRWEDNIKMDIQEMRCRGMEWMELAQDRDS
jgi:hypothetical protein